MGFTAVVYAMSHVDLEARRAYQKAYKAANKERIRELGRDWQRARRETESGREAALEAERTWRARNPDKVKAKNDRNNPKKSKAYTRNANLKAKHGITHTEYEQRLEEQKGCCFICGSERPGSRYKAFAVDHDHTTGKIRALLCQRCNIGLGWFKEKPELMERALAYLTQFG